MLRAELLGVVSTIATKVAAAVAVVGLLFTQVIFVTVLPALANGDIGPGAAALGDDFPEFDLASRAAQLDALSPLGASAGGGSIGIALLAIVLFGVLAGTSDDRYGGIVGAVLASPRRGRIVLAKAAAVGILGLVLGAVLVATSFASVLGTLAVTSTPVAFGAGDAVVTAVGGTLAVAALALLGLAVGILARGQLAAVLWMIAIVLVEPIIAALTGLIGDATGWTQFLPIALAQNVIHGAQQTVAPAVAGAALAALTGAALVVASGALSRRDV